MESGLDGRNNVFPTAYSSYSVPGLNGVRPRWPEQLISRIRKYDPVGYVSMESGLDGRNNISLQRLCAAWPQSLNGVRPRWPEQSEPLPHGRSGARCLNGVRPRWPEQCDFVNDVSNKINGLNGVRPRWPEQSQGGNPPPHPGRTPVSMESGLDGRNNPAARPPRLPRSRSLNGVRPRWPEQSGVGRRVGHIERKRLNGVRPRWPEQCDMSHSLWPSETTSQWSPA